MLFRVGIDLTYATNLHVLMHPRQDGRSVGACYKKPSKKGDNVLQGS